MNNMNTFIRISRLAGKQILSSQVINFNLVECMRATVTAHLSCTHADCFRERPKDYMCNH